MEQPPMLPSSASMRSTIGWLRKRSRTALRTTPVPTPWMTNSARCDPSLPMAASTSRTASLALCPRTSTVFWLVWIATTAARCGGASAAPAATRLALPLCLVCAATLACSRFRLALLMGETSMTRISTVSAPTFTVMEPPFRLDAVTTCPSEPPILCTTTRSPALGSQSSSRTSSASSANIPNQSASSSSSSSDLDRSPISIAVAEEVSGTMAWISATLASASCRVALPLRCRSTRSSASAASFFIFVPKLSDLRFPSAARPRSSCILASRAAACASSSSRRLRAKSASRAASWSWSSSELASSAARS
mmetsp:Transcript_5642/g.14382  ORF Transcript_5642/g.14382 Transcript_5642/m.14382 type:complete len:308 (+) Transcript_5642:220-1143(+)